MREYPRKIPTFFWEFPGHKPPPIDGEAYRLHINGNVERSVDWSLKDLDRELKRVSFVRRFYCVNGFSLQTEWEGFHISELVDVVRPLRDAKYMRTTSVGGYEDTTELSTLINGDAMLVTHMDGEPLQPKRGFPIRLMVFNLYQFKGVKAIQEISFVREYRPGTWQKVGYGDASIQPYPHLAIDRNEDLMPPDDVVGVN